MFYSLMVEVVVSCISWVDISWWDYWFVWT